VRQWRELIACEDHNLQVCLCVSAAANLGFKRVATLQRAWSAEDAHVLRRKGHLKEQDKFIEFIISMCYTHAPGEAFRKMENWVLEHRAAPKGSTLSRLVPSVGTFFTHLPLGQALDSYDEFSGLSRRRFVAPNFAEVRHVLNMAQVKASAPALRLITFDADGTLYADGAHFERDNAMIRNIIALLSVGLHVGVVTAAGYPGDALRFEGRLQGLLAAFRALPSGEELMSRFHLMGGECNYLLRCVGVLACLPDG
jgi:IMP and pyridine-specific 5'-nucleotidase